MQKKSDEILGGPEKATVGVPALAENSNLKKSSAKSSKFCLKFLFSICCWCISESKLPLIPGAKGLYFALGLFGFKFWFFWF